ncbi:MAG: hypothetical protein JXR83_15665 [Deltaproteobacteria bacterium]|nr:hypothetical protein [Deltaproteobacteria bacterium]
MKQKRSLFDMLLLGLLQACQCSVAPPTGSDTGSPGDAAATVDSGALDRSIVDAAANDGAAIDAPSDGAAVDAAPASDAASPDAGSFDSGSPDSGEPFPPAGTECEFEFFRHYFERDNGTAFTALRDASFLHIVQRQRALLQCGAHTTLGGLLSLMVYEGAGAKIAFYNDLCSQNSYNSSSTCWTVPKARYSYQFGLAPYHTSNFHPCADVGWTSRMRARLAAALEAAGFSPSADDVASVTADLHTFCPNATPTAVDFYILTVHSRFGVPTNSTGNDLPHAGTFPFFTPRVVIDLFFDTLEAACASLTSDEAAIGVYGGGDDSYRTPSKQAEILSLWRNYRAAHCP